MERLQCHVLEQTILVKISASLLMQSTKHKGLDSGTEGILGSFANSRECREAGPPFRETLAGGRNGLIVISWN